MRDYLLFSILMGSLPVCFLRPYIGIYMWYWIAFMNPHRLTWGFMFHFNIAQYVAIATMLGFVFMKRKNALPRERETVLLIVLGLLLTVNTLFAMFPDRAWIYWEQCMKILLMSIMTIWLIDSKDKLRFLVLVTTASIGFFALKAIPWAVATGGKYMLRGPERSFIASNNDIGMALNMAMPMMLFCAKNEKDRRVRLFFYLMFLASVIGVILTYSRGAFLGLAAMLFVLMIKSRRKVLAFLVFFLGIMLITTVVPQKWFDRMDTIRTYKEDGSARERIETWHFAFNLAMDRPLTGGGFQAFRANPSDFDAHSIYFGMMAEQGFIAFGLFCVLIAWTYMTLRAIRNAALKSPSLGWYGNLADLMQVSVIAYLVNGLTLGRQYFDFFYLLVAMSVIMKVLIRKELGTLSPAVKRNP